MADILDCEACWPDLMRAFCLAAYLASARYLGMVPRMPKSNTILWKPGVARDGRPVREDPDTFKSEYHQLVSCTETTRAATSRRTSARRLQFGFCYNIELVARSKARDGRLKSATMTA